MVADANQDGEGRNRYGRSSASDSSTEWYHATAADKFGSSDGSNRSISADQGRGERSRDTQNGSVRLPTSPGSSKEREANTSSDRRTVPEMNTPYLDLVTYPPQDLLKILAALLHQIASANDQLRPKNGETDPSAEATENSDVESKMRQRERNAAPEQALATPSGSNAFTSGDDFFGKAGNGNGQSVDWLGDSSEAGLSSSQLLLLQRTKPTTAALGALHTPSSTLCFRARNIPSISIEAYLLRILRYCPASCEVFVSLLVYFDRMSKMGQGSADRTSSSNEERGSKAAQSIRSTNGVGNTEHGTSNSDKQATSDAHQATYGDQSGQDQDDGLFVGMRGFAIDSFNVHRLVIAGVTVASKFFSDVFYTNSRYAKVGGLPVHELNQLELQFLLLNDFNLMIPLEEMQRYANQLLVYGGVSSVSPDVTRELIIPDPTAAISEKQRRERRVGDADVVRQPPPPVASTETPTSPRVQPSDQYGDTTMGDG